MTWGTNLATTEANREQNVTSGPGVWDRVELAGDLVPGIATVRARIGSGLDVQKPKGGKRATVTDNGDPLVEISIKLQLQPDELEEFRDFILPRLKPMGKTQGRDPVSILHPMCEVVNVANVIVRNITINPPQPGGTMTIDIDCLEWVPAPAAVKSKGAIVYNSGPAAPPFELDPRSPYNQTDDIIAGVQ